MQHVTVALNNASSEGGLLELARACGLSFLIDSTHIPAQGARTTRNFDGKFLILLGDFSQQHDLTSLRPSKSTMLFWHEADMEEIVNRLAKGQSYHTEPNEVSVSALFNLLRNFARQNPDAQAWLTKPFKIDALPEPLRAPVASAAFSTMLSNPSQPRMQAWLADEAWKSARVQLRSTKPQYPGEPIYALRWLVVTAPFASPAGAEQIDCTLPFGIPTTNTPVEAQELPPDAPLPASDGSTLRLLSSPLPLLDASSGAAMDAPVTLELERKTLRQSLDEVQKQSGVRLSTAAAPALDALLLSARAQKMPLFELMNGLSRLYAIAWKKTGEREWSADASPRTEDAVLATSVGHVRGYRWDERYGKALEAELRAADETIARALEEVDEQEMRSPKGVPFSALSQQVQKEVQDSVRRRIKLILALTQNDAQLAINEGLMLKVSPNGEILGVLLKDDYPHIILFNRSIFEPAQPLQPARAPNGAAQPAPQVQP